MCNPTTNTRHTFHRLLLMSIAIVLVSCSGCAMNSYADRGTAFGGLTGAAVGAAIGEHNDNPILGTAVGALAGAAVGNAVGNGIDADVAHANFESEQQTQLGMNNLLNQVANMSQQGVGEAVILNHIRSSGVPRQPTADEIIGLKQSGVSDSIVATLQSSVVPARVAPVSYGPRRVVVEEVHHWGPPVYYRPAPRFGYCPPPLRRSPGFSWGFSYRN